MRISLNWLRDYLDIKADVDISLISNSLTLAGLEVEGVEDVREKSSVFSLGSVISVRPLQDGSARYELEHKGEKISASGPRSSVVSGDLIAFKKKPKGDGYIVATFGDVGYSAQTGDLIAFNRNFFSDEVPDNLSRVKEFDDVIFSLGITPNRADALSHLGVSRELAAILDASKKSPMLTPKEMAGATHEKVAIEIENEEDCPRYACRLAEGVTIEDSPFWLKIRLLSVGIRPINNVVDVVNYVMMARGQPMHAFDYDKLHKDNTRGKIIVRRALAGEKLLALNGQELQLTTEDLVIADVSKPIALAGVIGGQDSAVNEATTTVLLESAFFEAKKVRISARRHGITTDSSYRFERGADPNGVIDALNYAARLLTEISLAKIGREPIDAYRKRIDPLEIQMRPERAQAVLGINAEDFDQDVLRRKFSRLGIETVAKRGDAIYFRIPTYRFDLSREIDLIEEAARMIGYDKVKEVSVGASREVAKFSDYRLNTVIEKLRDGLVSRGFSEAINYAFLNKDWQSAFIDPEILPIEVKNPLSDRYGVMRVSIVPSLVRNLQHNARNQEKSIQLFEIGTVFLGQRHNQAKPAPEQLVGKLDQDSFALEQLMLGGVLSGQTGFLAFDHSQRPFDFYQVKGLVSELMSLLGFRVEYPNPSINFEPGSNKPYLHPGESITLTYKGQGSAVIMGALGKIHPAVAASLDVSKDAFVFELDIEEIARHLASAVKFKPFSRFPIIERDVAFLVDESVVVADILQSASEIEAKENLLSLRIFDIYRGKNIEAGKKSVAVAMTLQKEDRTLTDEEADAVVADFIEVVTQKTNAKLRD